MRHVLFVSFHYPPESGSSGVLRSLKYTRYLVDLGWRATVLCPALSAYETIDDDLVRQVPGRVRVVRTPYRNSRRHFSIRGHYPALLALPDVWIGWLPWAVAAGLRVSRQDPFEVIYSTSPPATAHLVGRTLAKRLKKPHVVDFRDPWFEDPPEPGAPAGTLFRRTDEWLERGVVEKSVHVVTTTEALRDSLAERYRTVPPRRFTVIPNGYDEADFVPLPDPTPSSDRLRIVHAGSINPAFRDPVPLFKAIRAAADERRLDPARLAIRFLGGGPYAQSSGLAAAVAEAGLRGSVEFVPRVPYAQALAELARADVLLLLQASEDTRGLVPAKLYEYLRMQRPVLALVLTGEVTRLLAKTGGGVAVDPADGDRLSAVLASLFRAWQDRTLHRLSADPEIVRRYDRRELTRTLAGIFDGVST